MGVFCYSGLLLPFSHAVSRSLEVTYRARAGLLNLLYVMFSCVSVTFQYGVLGQVF